MRSRILAAALVMAAVLGGPLSARADGVIIPRPDPQLPAPPLRSLSIKYHRVTVTIDGQIATTHVDQVFVNETGHDLEGEYIFPVPEDATISSFAMWVDGQRLEAQVLDRDQAREIYEEIVRQQQDPALLEYAGRDAFRARIYPIPAYGEKRVELEYSEVLASDSGLIRYAYPLNTEKFSARPLQDVSVAVRVKGSQDLKTIYSPSHEVDIQRISSREAQITYQDENVTPSTDFVLYYSIGDVSVSVDALSYREGTEDGYFLLLLSPGLVANDIEPLAKDVFFVLDTSGSMRGVKLEQAKRAAKYVLSHLNPEDRFSLITFSSTVSVFASSLQPVGERDKAVDRINRLQANGGTNIDGALRKALEQTEEGRPQIIVFLTDGLATEGEVRTEWILEAIRDLAPANVRLFCFGVGHDVNTLLLDTMAQEQRGTSAYVQPGEDIERVVSSFYNKISLPVLTDVDIDFGDIEVLDVYPYPLPDVFAGGQMIVAGRYREGGSTDLTLTGDRGGEVFRQVCEDVVFSNEGGEAFVARLWATRKVGHLLTQIRLNGPEEELVDEIVALSVRFGIVTPYTSFLVDETEDALSSEGRQALADRELDALTPPAGNAPGFGAGGAAPMPTAASVTGRAAVEKSVAEEALRSAAVAGEPETEQVRHVGGKAFVMRDGVWYDTSLDSDSMAPERVVFGGDRYFDLLERNPDMGSYLALGTRVVIVWEGEVYEIYPDEDTATIPTTELATDRHWRWPV